MPIPSDLSGPAQVAVTFAQHLVRGDFVTAASLLTPDLRARYPPIALADAFFGMFRGYADALPTEVDFDEHSGEMSNFPGQKHEDLGWVYIGISGEDFNEGLACILTSLDGRSLIREIEWGRP